MENTLRVFEELVTESCKMKTNSLTLLFNHLDELIFIINKKMDVVLSNNKFQSFFHLNANNQQMSLIEITRNLPFNHFIENALCENNELEIKNFTFGQIEDPNQHFFDIKFIPLPHENQGLCILKDVTHKLRTNQIKEDFIANFSHEIKTPLTILTGQLSLLKNSLHNDSLFQKIENNSQRLIGLCDDMLSLSAIEKMDQIYLESIELQPLLEVILQDLEIKYSHRKICSQFSMQEKNIRADYRLLEQIFLNILENAIKYTDPNKTCILNISSSISGNHFLVTILDNGIGIPDEDKYRVFERFFRVDKSRGQHISGTGLGLSIVKHIMQKHLGRVKISDGSEGGTMVSLFFPT